MIKKTLFLLTSLLFIACSNEPNEEQQVAQAVENYYEMFLKSNFEGYVNGFDISTNAPHLYKIQLVANAKMYAKQIREEHKGILKAMADSVKIADNKQEANVFMSILFADSLKETVLVPMIKREEEWKMR